MASLAHLAPLSGLVGGYTDTQDFLQRQRSNEQLMKLRAAQLDDYQRRQQQETQTLGALGNYFSQQGGGQQQGQQPPSAIQSQPLPALPSPGAPSPGGGQALPPMSIPSRDPMVTSQMPTLPGSLPFRNAPPTGTGAGLTGPGAPPGGYRPAREMMSKPPAGPSPGMPGGGQQPQGGEQQLAQQADHAALQAGQQVPRESWGRADLRTLYQGIEKANPGASDAVKVLAMERLSKMMAPDQKQMWDMLKFGITEQRHEREFGQRESDRAEDRGFRAQQLGQGEQRLGLEGERVELERQRLAQGVRGAGGLEGDILRQQDEERKAKGLPPMSATERTEALSAIKSGTRPAGRQAAAQINAVVSAGNEAAASLSNLVDMGIGATSGVFMGTQMVPGAKLRDSMFRSLGNELTSEQAQRVDVAFQGVGRSLATIEAAGRATGLVALQGASQALKPALGDTPMTVLAKYAEIRQIVERGTESVSASSDIGKEQKALLERVRGEITKAVPWTVKDINALMRDPSEEKVNEFARRMGAAGSATGESHNVGDIVEKGGKRYRVTGGDPNDPEVEEVK